MKHLFVVLFLTLTVGLFARNEIKSTDEVYRQKDILTVQATEDSKIEAPSGSSAPTKLVDKRPQAGSVKKRLKSISFGTTEWTLSNDQPNLRRTKLLSRLLLGADTAKYPHRSSPLHTLSTT